MKNYIKEIPFYYWFPFVFLKFIGYPVLLILLFFIEVYYPGITISTREQRHRKIFELSGIPPEEFKRKSFIYRFIVNAKVLLIKKTEKYTGDIKESKIKDYFYVEYDWDQIYHSMILFFAGAIIHILIIKVVIWTFFM